jgi:hypothetical protein
VIEDRTLYPMLRPGSFVPIDSQQTKVESDGWHDEIRAIKLKNDLSPEVGLVARIATNSQATPGVRGINWIRISQYGCL